MRVCEALSNCKGGIGFNLLPWNAKVVPRFLFERTVLHDGRVARAVPKQMASFHIPSYPERCMMLPVQCRKMQEREREREKKSGCCKYFLPFACCIHIPWHQKCMTWQSVPKKSIQDPKSEDCDSKITAKIAIK